jgi:hypothetical protein
MGSQPGKESVQQGEGASSFFFPAFIMVISRNGRFQWLSAA